jgi:hypothetical protein
MSPGLAVPQQRLRISRAAVRTPLGALHAARLGGKCSSQSNPMDPRTPSPLWRHHPDGHPPGQRPEVARPPPRGAPWGLPNNLSAAKHQYAKRAVTGT